MMVNMRHLLVVCAIVFVQLQFCIAGETVWDIPKLDGIVIDGKGDDWGDKGTKSGILTPGDGEFAKSTDSSGNFRLGWDEKGLLLLVDVTDDNWSEFPDKNSLWKADSLELFLIPDKKGKTVCQWLVSAGMSDTQPQLRWNFHDNRNDEKLKKLPANLEIKRHKKSANSCTIEARLPWESMAYVPGLGKNFAFQLYVNDKDGTGGRYQTLWFPGSGTHANAANSYLCVLSDKATVPPELKSFSSVDIDNLEITLSAVAMSALAGKTVEFRDNEKMLGEKVILKADGSGFCVASVKVPVKSGKDRYGEISVLVDGKKRDTLGAPDVDKKIAENFIHEKPLAFPCVFSGTEFPEIRFKRPEYIKKLVGPFTMTTRFYNSGYEEVKKAEEAGRYGAVSEIAFADGRKQLRFTTLYRLENDIRWWMHSVDAKMDFPDEVGMNKKTVADFPKTTSEFIKWQIVNGFSSSSDGAIYFAGMREAKPSVKKDDFYNDPWQIDRQWWVGFKRKFYGWDKKWPNPFVCPVMEEGVSAPVVREGTPEEAGMKPGAAAQIDALLDAWANDSDQAFAVCIVRHGVIVLHKAYGERDGKPMTVNTPSWMASITKLINGTMMLMAYDKGLFDLDKPLGEYLPPLKDVKMNRPLTIRHLYTHTNGFSWHWGAEEADMEERMAYLIPTLKIGEKYAYNGTGFDMGSKVLEAVSGESLPNYCLNHLLKPLGCTNTNLPDGGGGTSSIPLDMAKIGQMLLNKGAYGAMRFMKEDTFRQLLPTDIAKVLPKPFANQYGFGTSWYKGDGLGEGTFGHGAASSATLRIDPQNNLVIVMTRNSAGKNFRKYNPMFIKTVMESIKK